MITILDLTTIITGTGTTGATIIHGDGTTTGSSNLITVGIIIIITIIAYLLDQRLNRKLDLDQELLQTSYQNREKIEQELE